MRILRYAIFDMDGTLLDSTGMWNTVSSKVLGRWGLQLTSRIASETMTTTVEETAAYYVAKFGLPATQAEVAACIRAEARTAYTTLATLKPGVPEMLAAMQACGVTMCVASGTEKPLVDAALEHFDVLKYFKFTAACLDDVGKDEPEVYLRAMHGLGVSAPSQVMVFEDSPVALHTAKSAGFYTVGVQDKYTANAWPEIKAEADATVQSWQQFAEEIAAQPTPSIQPTQSL